ncbi:MAG: beta-galactosidase trimerization domain-containing protein [Verrucomicrobia bacterium]|nr:beta-galactosidase trimerization domain-containing protein [Verrucomicrobiota bacterium]MDA1088223.1 beta-galactosidase trimerization domain-containing protein [Verrucomicrobiota bacterium]
MHELRYRQIHLDFHTSPAIPGIGAKFDKHQWQDALKRGHVDSITCFGVCHHGWNYNDTTVGERHPHLEFDLLRAQFDACKEIDVNVPIYITAGVSTRVAEAHPEWRVIKPDGGYGGWTASPLQPGFKSLCFNSPYTDYLGRLIEEIVRQVPTCDGIFLDIISQAECCCGFCLTSMKEAGLDPECQADRHEMSRRSLQRYYKISTAACRCDDPAMPVFHNSGHITRGQRDILKYFSHLELESLPTGGWGYDHFPVSAKYCKNLNLDFLGMTGKFHTTWGEFGGYKHPNALRYECAAMIAFGSKCSVGDQLHPSGEMDGTTYDIIGAAYSEVEAREPWCNDVSSVAEIAVLSSAAVNSGARDSGADDGAARILLEGHFLFDVIDTDMPFDRYAMLILPDDVSVDDGLLRSLNEFLAGGGKLLLSAASGQLADGRGHAFDIGAECSGLSPYQPDFVLPAPDMALDFVKDPLVMYLPSYRIKALTDKGVVSLGEIYDPYFNRAYDHFCSHQHAPPQSEPSGYDCGTLNQNTMYLAHPVFTHYRATGAVAHRDYVVKAIELLLGDRMLETNLPSTARVSLMDQTAANRYVLHLLFANTINRGGRMDLSGGSLVRQTQSLEVIEDLLPLHNTTISIRLPREIKRVTLEPEGTEQPFTARDGKIELTVTEFTCHQMVVFHY